jgi:hypothetical protein
MRGLERLALIGLNKKKKEKHIGEKDLNKFVGFFPCLVLLLAILNPIAAQQQEKRILTAEAYAHAEKFLEL